MTTRHLLLVLSVLCVPTAAFAQDEGGQMAEVICLDDQECLALARYRLTAENLRKMFAADRELMPLMKDLEFHTRMSEVARNIDPQERLGTVTLGAQVYERMPEIAQVLRRHQISGRDYAFTHMVAMTTGAMNDALTYEIQRGERKEIASYRMTPALKFWQSMDPALKAEADAWRKMRGYDKGFSR